MLDPQAQMQLLKEIFKNRAFAKRNLFILNSELDTLTLTTWLAAAKKGGLYTASRLTVQPGEKWKLRIKSLLRQSDVVLALHSDSVISRGTDSFHLIFHLAQEIALAKPKGTLFIVPVRLDEYAIPADMSLQWVNVWEKDAAEKIRKAFFRALSD